MRRRYIGRQAKPLRHKDFLREVPLYTYVADCGHLILYGEAIPFKQYGYCRGCHDSFRHDYSVQEIPPRSTGHKRVSDKELAVLIDKAIVRNRIADRLWETGLYLPSSTNLTDDDLRHIGSSLRRAAAA